MSKLLTIYGNTMMAIGTWFFKRGAEYAEWYPMPMKEETYSQLAGE